MKADIKGTSELRKRKRDATHRVIKYDPKGVIWGVRLGQKKVFAEWREGIGLLKYSGKNLTSRLCNSRNG